MMKKSITLISALLLFSQFCFSYVSNNQIAPNFELIDSFDKNINFILSFEKGSHYKIHINNLNDSIVKYLEALKKDLDSSHQINIKKLD